ncbi:MAG: methionine--tRNA ligase [Rhodobacteraceae bacterium]|nr:methionine--tRNA ligase [Paracoccaceae bacterium]
MKRILVTSALPYINGVKHLGNLIGSQLPSDVYARFMRSLGFEVLFICATDEHGTPAELAAKSKGIPVEDFCKEMWLMQKKIADDFNISFDHFGRSSSNQNYELTQHFATKLWENNYIDEIEENQVYSLDDERFLPDRYITGKCPACGYEKARGDQCENCTKQLDPTDLIDPTSTISGSKLLEIRQTKHLFLKQSLLKNKLEEWVSTKEAWPILTKSIAKKWLNTKEGLKDRSITRDLSWGVPVKKYGDFWPGFEEKVFYVWFDAPIAYIAATKEWSDHSPDPESWKTWWLTGEGAENVFYVQFMAKDNIPFHTISFPATIFGSGENWKLVDFIKGFNWLLYEGGKFSTSERRGIFMDKALDIYPADYWRWWLLSNAPESSDTDFTWASFQSTINKDLADVLGNFISRVSNFSVSKFGKKVPENKNYGYLEIETIRKIDLHYKSLKDLMKSTEIRKSCSELRTIWVIGNEYLQKAAPWSSFKENPKKSEMIIRFALNLIYFYSLISEPFIPSSCEKIQKHFQFKKVKIFPDNLKSFIDALSDVNEISVPKILFQKISDEETMNYQKEFSGS